MQTFMYRCNRFCGFTNYEFNQLLLTTLAASFILSFRNWGGQQFSFLIGLFNWILAFIIFFFSLYVHHLAQKAAGLKVGYFPSYRAYPSFLIIGVVLAFFTDGNFPFFIPGCLTYTIEERMRLGKLRKGYTLWEASLVSFSGPLTSVIVASILGLFYSVIPIGFVYSIITTNLLIAIYSMLPFPQIQKFNPAELIVARSHRFGKILLHMREGGPAGLHVFMHSRVFFVLTFSLVLFYSGLVFTAQTFSLLLALVLSLITGVIYYYLVEKSG